MPWIPPSHHSCGLYVRFRGRKAFRATPLVDVPAHTQGILGNTTGRRPGDVTFPRWAGGKGLAIDVAVTSCLAPTYVRLPEPCEWYAATQKHGKYSMSFEGTEYIFSAMVFETLGAVNADVTAAVPFCSQAAGS